MYAGQSSRLGALVMLVCCGLCFFGQQLVSGQYWSLLRFWPSRSIPLNYTPVQLGMIITLAASIAYGYMCPKVQNWWLNEDTDHLRQELAELKARISFYRAAAWILVPLSIAAIVASQYIFAKQGETYAVRGLWLLGACLFGFGLLAVFAYENRRAHWAASPAFRWIHWIVLATIVAAALFLRGYEVSELPRKVNYDLAIGGNVARYNLSEHGWHAVGLGTFDVTKLAFSLISLSMTIFGEELFGLRMTDVILGTLMVCATYLAAWRSFDCHRVAAIAAGSMAINLPHIHFSRHFFNIDPWAIFSVGLFFLAHGLRAYARWAFGAAGLFTGIAMQLYLSGRSLCFVMPVFMILLHLQRPNLKVFMRRGWVFFALGIFVSWGPNLVDLLSDTRAWKESNRPWSTFLLVKNIYEFSLSHQLPTIPQIFSQRLWTILLLLNTPDTSGQSPSGFLFFNNCIAPFFWLGLGVALFERRRNAVQLLLLVLLVVSTFFGVGMMSIGTYWPKILFVTLVGALFIGRGVSSTIDAFRSLLACPRLFNGKFDLPDGLLNIALQIVVSATILTVGVQNWQIYRKEAAKDDFTASVLGWYVSSLPAGAKVCGVKDDHLDLDELPVTFLAHKQIRRSLSQKEPAALISECGSAPFVWIITENQPQLLNTLKSSFPDGIIQEHDWWNGQPLFRSFEKAHS